MRGWRPIPARGAHPRRVPARPGSEGLSAGKARHLGAQLGLALRLSLCVLHISQGLLFICSGGKTTKIKFKNCPKALVGLVPWIEPPPVD